jgi:hypothetical protein
MIAEQGQLQQKRDVRGSRIEAQSKMRFRAADGAEFDVQRCF